MTQLKHSSLDAAIPLKVQLVSDQLYDRSPSTSQKLLQGTCSPIKPRNLKPLGQDQQQRIIEKQLQRNEFFKHLMGLSVARTQQDTIFKSFSASQQQALKEMQFQGKEEVTCNSNGKDVDHEILAAVFFCVACRLLSEAGLDGNALQLPSQKGSEAKADVRRLSLHARQQGVIRSDFVCPDAGSLRKVLELLVSFSTLVDGDRAELQILRCANFFARPGPEKFRYFSCDLRLSFQQCSHPVKVQVHHADGLECFRQADAQEHVAFLRQRLAGTAQGELLEARLQVFDEIRCIPVLLSVLACAFAVEIHRLPADIYELYEMGMFSTLKRQLSEDQVDATFEMLETIAVANHLAKRRTFQAEDLRVALKGKPHLLGLWSQLLEDGSVPLIKVLTLGELTGEFQFSHLSFQEALFVRALGSGCLATSFWRTHDALNSSLNDPFYRNALLIGRCHLGNALAGNKPCLSFDCQPRLTELGRLGLRNIVAGAQAIEELDLANVNLQNSEEVVALVSSLTSSGLPKLRVLGLSRCRLSGKSAQAIGTLLRCCSSLQKLDLEGNRCFLQSEDAVDSLSQSIGDGLRHLQFLSLRWCHIRAGSSMRKLLQECCPALSKLDVQGNQGLTRSLLEECFAPECLQGC
ncbi:unnamed protein product [Effrenium voratum]|nr:unnamed protein product [Effrenium voratum]